MLNKWRCKACGYVHRGETLPPVCPLCALDSSVFEEIPLKSTGKTKEKNLSERRLY